MCVCVLRVFQVSSWDPTKVKTTIRKSASPSSSSRHVGEKDDEQLGNLKVREELNSTMKNSDPLYDKVRDGCKPAMHEVYTRAMASERSRDATDSFAHVFVVPCAYPAGATAADVTESRWTQDGDEQQVRQCRGTSSSLTYECRVSLVSYTVPVYRTTEALTGFFLWMWICVFVPLYLCERSFRSGPCRSNTISST